MWDPQVFYIANYTAMLFVLLLDFILCSVIYLLVKILSNRFWNNTSISSTYECGFLPLNESHIQFDIKFYMVALSFIVFDLETIFLFPWFLIYTTIPYSGYLAFIYFFMLIIFGMILEWRCGVFDWN